MGGASLYFTMLYAVCKYLLAPCFQDMMLHELKSDSTVVCDSEEEMMSSDEEDATKDGGLEWDDSSY